jgi:hypothetical protein
MFHVKDKLVLITIHFQVILVLPDFMTMPSTTTQPASVEQPDTSTGSSWEITFIKIQQPRLSMNQQLLILKEFWVNMEIMIDETFF